MAELHRTRTGQHLMVHRLIDNLLKWKPGEPVLDEPSGGHRMAQHRVHLVEGQPVLDEAPKAFKAGASVFDKQIDALPRIPALEVRHQREGRVVVGERHDGFDAVRTELLEQVKVVCDALLVGHWVARVGVDAAPADRDAERSKSHLSEKLDIPLVAMVEIDSAPLGVVIRGIRSERAVKICGRECELFSEVGDADLAMGQAVLDRHALSALIPSAFDLVGRCGPTP